MPEVEAGLADAGVAGAPAQEESIFVAHGDEAVSDVAVEAESESEFAEFEPIAFVEHQDPEPAPAPVVVQAAPRRENPALIRLERFHRAILVSRARRRSQSAASDSVGQGY
jgi:hypothetical protein